MERETILPLVLKNGDGSVADVLLQSEKGYRKSIEQRVLWYVHRDTGRLLPYKENTPFQEIAKKGSWYEAELYGGGAASDRPASEADETAGATPAVPAPPQGDVLSALAEVIRRRRIELPEGSYTTHLFTSGEEKIRKKTGEEAVELILARSEEEVIYEAADLIYHMLVLLESLGIDYRQVLAELAKRAR